VYSIIVVGTDGTETASRAVSVAAELARRTGATVHLVRAEQDSVTAAAFPDIGVIASDIALAQDDLRHSDEVERALEGIPIARHAAAGPPAEVIVEIAKRVNADLIVVGNKGMNRRILGSVPNSIAHSAHCAVLIVKTT
jgi:nucleotide-binding universal stress UspA family protein